MKPTVKEDLFKLDDSKKRGLGIHVIQNED